MALPNDLRSAQDIALASVLMPDLFRVIDEG
jgi:hypothetical protein